MISAVVLARNEEKNITKCIASLKWCGEIVVIDDFSEDRTVEAAEKSGAKVYRHKLEDDFSAQRNFGLEKAKGDWLLFVDADERVSQELRDEVIQIIAVSVTQNGFLLRRRDILWGRELKYGETGKIKLLRLARKNAGKWRRKVHEIWDVTGEIGELKSHLVHYPHQTISEFIADINRYSTLHAGELAKEGKKSNIVKVIFWPKMKFLHKWIFKLGLLDGVPGFVVSGVMAFHSFLSWGKLWLTTAGSERKGVKLDHLEGVKIVKE